jgi:hypothetical protein
MRLGQNILTIKGPSQILNRIHDTGLALHRTNDISGNLWLSTYSEMYFGSYIYVLGRTPTCLTVQYKSPGGILKPYLETLIRKYRHCFFKNEYRDPSKIDTWMGRFVHGKVVEQMTEPEDMDDYEVT